MIITSRKRLWLRQQLRQLPRRPQKQQKIKERKPRRNPHNLKLPQFCLQLKRQLLPRRRLRKNISLWTLMPTLSWTERQLILLIKWMPLRV
jgi:hypothetical protein